LLRCWCLSGTRYRHMVGRIQKFRKANSGIRWRDSKLTRLQLYRFKVHFSISIELISWFSFCGCWIFQYIWLHQNYSRYGWDSGARLGQRMAVLTLSAQLQGFFILFYPQNTFIGNRFFPHFQTLFFPPSLQNERLRLQMFSRRRTTMNLPPVR
jgi:hypothetical protein